MRTKNFTTDSFGAVWQKNFMNWKREFPFSILFSKIQQYVYTRGRRDRRSYMRSFFLPFLYVFFFMFSVNTMEQNRNENQISVAGCDYRSECGYNSTERLLSREWPIKKHDVPACQRVYRLMVYELKDFFARDEINTWN